MSIRPRLLVASLAVAAAVVAAVVAYAWTQRSDGDAVDARLTNAGEVIPFPSDGIVNGAVAGEILPATTLVDVDGDDMSTTDLLGAPMVLNLWYSWCAPCATELPEFATVDAETDDVQFVGVNPYDTAETMQRFAADRGVEYPLYQDEDSALIDDLRLINFPVTLFVTSDGTIIEQTGPLDADELREKIDNLLQVEEATT